jgi:predicted secreted Zn-dependent protease
MQLIRKIFVFVLFLFPFFAIAQNDESIEWSSDKRLSWADYLAKPITQSGAAAITSTTIGIEYHVRNNKFSYSITCRFSKTRSWGKYKTAYILQHEQGHFDITEIYARKLAKELKEYKFNSGKYQDDVTSIYKRLMDEKEDYQNKYDKETDFSRNKEKQAEWLEKIRDELDETDEFANYQATINI